MSDEMRDLVEQAVAALHGERSDSVRRGLVTRTVGALEQRGVRSLDDLRTIERASLRRWKNVGEMSMAVIGWLMDRAGCAPDARVSRERWARASRDDRWAVLGLLRVEAADPQGMLSDERIEAFRAAIAVLESLEPADDRSGPGATP